jgi:hypothetical protein
MHRGAPQEQGSSICNRGERAARSPSRARRWFALRRGRFARSAGMATRQAALVVLRNRPKPGRCPSDRGLRTFGRSQPSIGCEGPARRSSVVTSDDCCCRWLSRLSVVCQPVSPPPRSARAAQRRADCGRRNRCACDVHTARRRCVRHPGRQRSQRSSPP